MPADLFNQFFDIVNANINFRIVFIQNVYDVILRTKKKHDHILWDEEFFEKGTHLSIGDGIITAFADMALL